MILRRTFGASKDQYFLNRKPINKVRCRQFCGPFVAGVGAAASCSVAVSAVAAPAVAW